MKIILLILNFLSLSIILFAQDMTNIFDIDQDSFNTLSAFTTKTVDTQKHIDKTYSISIITDKKQNHSILINKMINNKIIDSLIIDIPLEEYSNHMTYSTSNDYLDFVVLKEDDLIISYNLGSTFHIFRILNNDIIWNKKFELDIYRSDPKMTMDSNQDIYIAQNINTNFFVSNYDILITKMNIDGDLLINKNISTPDWDNIMAIENIGDNIFIIGAFNGLNNYGITKLTKNLEFISYSKLMFPGNDFSINHAVSNNNILYVSAHTYSTRAKYMPSVITAITEDLDIKWSYGFEDDILNYPIKLKNNGNNMQMLFNTIKKNSYDKKNNKYHILNFTDQGEIMSRGSFILPPFIEIASFEIDFNSLDIFADQVIYQGYSLSKIGFHFQINNLLNKKNPQNLNKRDIYTTLVIQNNVVNISPFDFVITDTYSNILDINVKYFNEYPWSEDIINEATFFEQSAE